MKKSIQGLNKLVKMIAKGDESRTEEIKNETLIIKNSYQILKQQLLNANERLSVIEK